MLQSDTYREGFNVLCGDLIGEGSTRKVFTCKIRDDLVVKVEDGDWRQFANIIEMKFWCDHMHHKQTAVWLAPCEYMSPDGRVMLQKRATPLRDNELPSKLPAFLTDLKRENFGMLDGKIVCIDYALTIPAPSLRMRNVSLT